MSNRNSILSMRFRKRSFGKPNSAEELNHEPVKPYLPTDNRLVKPTPDYSNVRIYKAGPAKVILIMNSKGGSGKTTISTNLASLLAARSNINRVVLVDHDPQGSTARWLRVRSPRHRSISGVFPARDNLIKFKRTWRLQVASDATHVIVDSPAGISSFELSDRIRESDTIIIPVMPSAIDIAATADFVSKIFVNPAYVNSNKKMAVVANGVNREMHNFEKLERFLFSLKIPFLSVFSDHSRYLVAAERGCGINELTGSGKPFYDIPEWEKILEWLEED